MHPVPVCHIKRHTGTVDIHVVRHGCNLCGMLPLVGTYVHRLLIYVVVCGVYVCGNMAGGWVSVVALPKDKAELVR